MELRMLRLALGLALFFSLALCQSSSNSNSRITLTDFQKDFYMPVASHMQEQLAPCGCLGKGLPPRFPLGHGGKHDDSISLADAEMTFHTLTNFTKTLMQTCQCVAGIHEAMVLYNESVQEWLPNLHRQYLTYDNAQMLKHSFNARVDLIYQICCDPAKSKKDYEIVTDALSWNEAEQYAEAKGGRLAVVENRHDCSKLVQLLATISNDQVFWLGLRRTNGVWHWPDDKEMTFANWGFVSPADVTGNCAGTKASPRPGARGAWHSLPCSQAQPFVVENMRFHHGASNQPQIVIIVIGVLAAVFIIVILVIIARKVIPRFAPDTGDVVHGRRTTATTRRGARRRRHGNDADEEMNNVVDENNAEDASPRAPTARRRRRRTTTEDTTHASPPRPGADPDVPTAIVSPKQQPRRPPSLSTPSITPASPSASDTSRRIRQITRAQDSDNEPPDDTDTQSLVSCQSSVRNGSQVGGIIVSEPRRAAVARAEPDDIEMMTQRTRSSDLMATSSQSGDVLNRRFEQPRSAFDLQ